MKEFITGYYSLVNQTMIIIQLTAVFSNFSFWLVNILLWKFGTLSKKETKMIKSQFFDKKQQQEQKPKKNI